MLPLACSTRVKGGVQGDGDGDGDEGLGGMGGDPGTNGDGDTSQVDLSIIAQPGDRCFISNALGCMGSAQDGRIICLDGTWTAAGSCPEGEHCDTRAGSAAGTCAAIVPECKGLEPGDGARLCNQNTPQRCGPDLVSTVSDDACESNEGCVAGECVEKLPECEGRSAGDAVCSEDFARAFRCGATLASREEEENCAYFCQAGTCVEPPSCDGLAETCGPDKNENCCTSLIVPGGTYSRGTEEDYFFDVSTFRLDRFEVTVGRFRKFVRAVTDEGFRPAEGSGKHTHANNGAGLDDSSGFTDGWRAFYSEPQNGLHAQSTDWNTDLQCDSFPTWTLSSSGGRESKPINCVNWYQAQAFCIWDGGFLPTYDEWEYAAAGGSEERTYPWGEVAPSISFASYDCLFDGLEACGQADIPEVGSTPLGDSRWGHADLAGSMYELTLEPYGGWWVVRGGGWNGVASDLDNSVPNVTTPSPATRYHNMGFRCARSP